MDLIISIILVIAIYVLMRMKNERSNRREASEQEKETDALSAPEDDHADSQPSETPGTGTQGMSDEIINKIKIKIINLENYYGRPLTEKEKEEERDKTEFFYKLDLKLDLGKAEPSMTKEEMNRIIKEEELDKYLRIILNDYPVIDERYAIVNKVSGYYTYLTVGEKGRLTANEVFDTEEKLYYYIVEEMRYYARGGFQPFKEGGNPFESDAKFIDWAPVEPEDDHADSQPSEMPGAGTPGMSDEIKNKIRVINLENYYGRRLTEEEKEKERERPEYCYLNQKEPSMTREEMNQIIKKEKLDQYFRITLNNYDDVDCYHAVVNKVRGYYTYLTLGETGNITENEVFDSEEKLYYYIIRRMRSKAGGIIRRFQEGRNPFEGDVKFVDWADWISTF